MNCLSKLMIKLQLYLISRKTKKKCSSCGEYVVPIKGISILNIGIYFLISSVAFFITKEKLSFLILIVLSIINSLFAKPVCPLCKENKFIDEENPSMFS